MRYDDMPKGRNKDRCVRCGKRYNFADKALSKAKVPYDLLCLAEVTASGYMTHGNVKLCDECMVELLMWLDRKTERMKTTDYCDICKRDMCEDCIADATNPYCVPSHYEINYEPKDEPKTQMKTQNSNLTFEKRTMRDCYNCKRYETEGECVECHYEPKDEPQTDTEIAKAIVHKMIDDAVIAEDAYPDLRQKMHDAVDEYEPQTEKERASDESRSA